MRFLKREAIQQVSVRGEHNNDAGFSLIEMLVALSVFSALSIMGVIVLSSFTEGQSALQSADERLAHMQTASNIIRDDLASALVRPARGVLGGSGDYFAGGKHTTAFGADEVPLLRLVRGNHAASRFDASQPNIQTLEYWLQDGVLTRRIFARPDANEVTPVYRQTLMSDLEEISLRFNVQGTWVDGLEAIVGARSSLPELVEMRFTFTGERTLTRVFVVGAAG